jgi:DNA-binding response OmpR family regulator
MKILFVDDDKHIQLLYLQEFLEEGYEVCIAGTGEEALQLFEEETPDLVSLDILMPDIDGIQLLRKMKEQKPHVPIIMNTAYDYRDDFALWASDSYIIKSFDTSELKRTIKSLLQQ